MSLATYIGRVGALQQRVGVDAVAVASVRCRCSPRGEGQPLELDGLLDRPPDPAHDLEGLRPAGARARARRTRRCRAWPSSRPLAARFAARSPNSCSNRSPISRPRVSLTSLNRSRFITNTASSRVRVRRLGDRARPGCRGKGPGSAARSASRACAWRRIWRSKSSRDLLAAFWRVMSRITPAVHCGVPSGPKTGRPCSADPAWLPAQVDHPVLERVGGAALEGVVTSAITWARSSGWMIES